MVLLIIFNVLLIISLVAFLIGTFIYYFSYYKYDHEGNKYDIIYMTWKEYRKYSKMFPDRYYLGHERWRTYHNSEFDQLFFNDERNGISHLMPIKFHFFTGYYPWVFFSLWRRFVTKKTETIRINRQTLNDARKTMLETLQGDVVKELKAAQKEIAKAKAINDTISQRLAGGQ